MFTRRKHNRSGTISVVVVDKSGGRFTEIHRVGIAHNEEEVAALEAGKFARARPPKAEKA